MLMKGRLLVSVAAVALAAGTVLVAAQGTPGGSPPGAQGQGQPQGQPGTEPKGTPKTGTPPKAADPKAQNGAPPGTAQPKTTEPKGTAQPKEKSTEPKGTAQPKTTEPKGTAQPKSDDKGAPKTDSAAPKTGEKQGGAQTTVNINVQQRTEIRQTIIKGGGPRVTNVDFSISIGTVVPRTAKVVVLPARVVEIYPQWRGYRYFIVGERIIIIDDGWRIVFIIEA